MAWISSEREYYNSYEDWRNWMQLDSKIDERRIDYLLNTEYILKAPCHILLKYLQTHFYNLCLLFEKWTLYLRTKISKPEIFFRGIELFSVLLSDLQGLIFKFVCLFRKEEEKQNQISVQWVKISYFHIKGFHFFETHYPMQPWCTKIHQPFLIISWVVNGLVLCGKENI